MKPYRYAYRQPEMSLELRDAFAGLLLGTAALENAIETGYLGRHYVGDELNTPNETWARVNSIAKMVNSLGQFVCFGAVCGPRGLRGVNIMEVARALNGIGEGYIVLERGGGMHLEGLGSWLKDRWNDVKKGVDKVGDKVGDAASAAGKAVKEGAIAVAKTVEKGATWVAEGAASLGKDVAKGVAKAGDAIGSAASTVWSYVKDPGKIIDDLNNLVDGLKKELRKLDPTTEEGMKLWSSKLRYLPLPFGWPMSEFIAGLGMFINCLRGKGKDKMDSGKGKEDVSVLQCIGEFIVDQFKRIVTSGEFQVVLGYFTQNWPLVIAGALKVTGGLLQAVMGDDPKTGQYVLIAFKVVTDGMDIAKLVMNQGLDVIKNAALYVMIGELFRSVAKVGTVAYTAGVVLTDHARIIAKLCSGEVAAAFEDLRAKYIDPLTSALKNVDASTIAGWAAIGAGLAAVAVFFYKVAGAHDKDDWQSKKENSGFIKKTIATLGDIFQKMSDQLAFLVNTFNDAKKIASIAQNPAALQAQLTAMYEKGKADALKLQQAVTNRTDTTLMIASANSRVQQAVAAQADMAAVTQQGKEIFTKNLSQAQQNAATAAQLEKAYAAAADPITKNQLAKDIQAAKTAQQQAVNMTKEGVYRVDMAEVVAKKAKEEEQKARQELVQINAAVAKGQVPKPIKPVKSTAPTWAAAALPLVLLL